MPGQLTSLPPPQVSVPNVDRNQTLGFSLANPFQSNWRGVCADYMGFAAFPLLGETEEQQTAEFDRAEQSGIKMARTWYDFSWPLATYPTGVPDFSGASMGYFYTWLTAMQTRGINVVLNMGWHFPGDVKGVLNSGTAPTPADETAWKGIVSASLGHFINVLGYTNIVACMFFTEPENGDSTPIPLGYGSAYEYYAHLVSIARAKIAADDASRTPILPRVLLLGAQEDTADGSHPYLDYIIANNDSDYDVYTMHMYCEQPSFAPLGLTASGCLAAAPWTEQFRAFVATASPKELWADETGFLIGGDADSTGYRSTADAGWQLIRQVDGHMQAGCAASFPWMLQDQRWFYDASIILKYGVAGDPTVDNAVHPAYYAFALHANLTGGGTGTLLYRPMNVTATLHGTGVFVPFGLANAVDPAGEWTFVVINEDVATDAGLSFDVSLNGRTVYRYDYSGEYPPQATGPFLPAWTRKFTGVTTSVPATRIPGRGVCIFSTMNISAPTAENLALLATATSSDAAASGAPANVNDGNWTNCTGTQNGWRKSTNGSQSVTLTWGAAVTVGRVNLAFVATTAGVTWATYADSSTPAPLADYTVEYWNGGSWVQVVSVTGNALPSRSHSFGPVSTTAIRLNATSAAATAQLNQMGAFAA